MKNALRFAGLLALTLAVCFIAVHIGGFDHAHAAIGGVMAIAGAPASDTKELLAQVSKELVEHSDKLTKQAEAAMAEVKNLGTLSEQTKKTVDEALVNQTALTKHVEKLQAQLDEVEQKSVRRGAETAVAQSVGAQVIASEGLKAFAASVQGGRRVSVAVKNTTTSTGYVPTTAAPVVQPQILPGIVPLLQRRLFVRDLLSPGTTTSPAIFWVQQTGFTNNASVVSEGTTKPYSNITFATKITPVTTVAHMFKASKQILDDFAQLQSTIDDELQYGLKFAEENEILFGDGTGVHLHGIVPQATAYAHQFTVPMQTSIDDVRLAMLQSQLARIPASGIVMHFTDWAHIELTKDSLGRYVIGNPQGNLAPSLWGLPVVGTEISTFAGKFLTGPFKGGSQIFDREESNVVVSTENSDDFEKNLISVRCEERLALAVKRPEGFIYGAFTVAT